MLAKLSQFKELVKHAVVDRNKRKELERWMKKQLNIKKLLLLNLPYILMGLVCHQLR